MEKDLSNDKVEGDVILVDGDNGDDMYLCCVTETTVNDMRMVLYDSKHGLQIAFYIDHTSPDPSGVEFGDAKEFIRFVKLLDKYNVAYIGIAPGFIVTEKDIKQILQTHEVQNL